MVPDRKTALPVENDVGADPAMLPNFDIAENQDIVIAGRAFKKSVITGNFPPVSINPRQKRAGEISLAFRDVNPRSEYGSMFETPSLFFYLSYTEVRHWRSASRTALATVSCSSSVICT